MEMLRRPSAAALGIPTDPSAEAVDVVTAAPQPAGAMTTSTTGSRLPMATSSSNSDNEEGSGRLSQRVALIDPKPLTRRSIADLLAKAFPECGMVAASTCEELLEIDETRIGRPNLVVVYIRNVGLTSTYVQSALELLRVRLPEASTVVLSDRDDVAEVNRALAHGVRGYIPTSVECGVAVAALRLISAGGTFVPADALRSTAAKSDDQPEGERQRRSDGLDLTPRELSVIDLLREGKPNKLIAARLDMQENTVKVHVRNILKKLNAANRTHAAFVANRLLGQDAEPVALPNSLRPIDQAQSPGTPKRSVPERITVYLRAAVVSPMPTCRSTSAPSRLICARAPASTTTGCGDLGTKAPREPTLRRSATAVSLASLRNRSDHFAVR
jgi:DNA-binding NarL/FixJ family response regulator